MKKLLLLTCSALLSSAETELFSFDFGKDSNFDIAVYLGNDLPVEKKQKNLSIGDNVEFFSRGDEATGLSSSNGSAIVFWGIHTGFSGTKTFEITQEQLDGKSTIDFKLEVGNWFPSALNKIPKDTSARNFSAKILLGTTSVGTLEGTSPERDSFSTYSLSVDTLSLSPGTYSLVLEVEIGGKYTLIDQFKVLASE